MKFASDKLAQILENHELWVKTKGMEGTRANLSYEDLSFLNLANVNLKSANLFRANLTRTNLSGANLSEANLSEANLFIADLSKADLSKADLYYANLSEADLSEADLSEAKLQNVIGNMAEVKSLQIDKWIVVFTKDVMQIGCQRHPIENWWVFSDEEIKCMDRYALNWWYKYKSVLKTIITESNKDVG